MFQQQSKHSHCTYEQNEPNEQMEQRQVHQSGDYDIN